MYVQNKHKGNKVDEAKTVENIKYEPILSSSSDFNYRAGTYNKKIWIWKMAENSSHSTHCGQNLIL